MLDKNVKNRNEMEIQLEISFQANFDKFESLIFCSAFAYFVNKMKIKKTMADINLVVISKLSIKQRKYMTFKQLKKKNFFHF